jgi:serine/threonine protein kinase
MLIANLDAKIGDFGYSQPNLDGINTTKCSEFHRAPEISNRIFPYDGEKADVFSLAIVLFALQMKAFPFGQCNAHVSPLYRLLINGN